MVKVKKKLEHAYMQQIHYDILMISIALNNIKDVEHLYRTHIYIDAKYQPFIEQWGKGLYGWHPDFGFIYNDISDSKEMLDHNLRMMKSKLESYRFYFNVEDTSKNPPSKITNINNSKNYYESNYYFDHVTQYIKNNYGSSDKQEILDKIDEIKTIINSSDSREDKWGKLSKIGKWIFDRSVDVGFQLLPLIMGLK